MSNFDTTTKIHYQSELSAVLRGFVFDLVRDNEEFTSVTLSNKAKRWGKGRDPELWVPHKDVSQWLRVHFTNVMGDFEAVHWHDFKYKSSLKRLTTGEDVYVYHPEISDGTNFQEEHALAPDQMARDRLNTVICSGDRICYPGRQGSSLWMNDAIFLCTVEGAFQVQRTDGKKRTLRTIGRVTKVG